MSTDFPTRLPLGKFLFFTFWKLPIVQFFICVSEWELWPIIWVARLRKISLLQNFFTRIEQPSGGEKILWRPDARVLLPTEARREFMLKPLHHHHHWEWIQSKNLCWWIQWSVIVILWQTDMKKCWCWAVRVFIMSKIVETWDHSHINTVPQERTTS